MDSEPNIINLAAIVKKINSELAQVNWVFLYGLLNFYKEYILAFTELIKLLCQLFGQGTQPWMMLLGSISVK